MAKFSKPGDDATHEFVFGSSGAYGSVCQLCGLPEQHAVHGVDIAGSTWSKSEDSLSYEERISKDAKNKAQKESRFAMRFSVFSLILSSVAVVYNVLDGWLF